MRRMRAAPVTLPTPDLIGSAHQLTSPPMTTELPPATFNRPRAVVFGALAGGVMALGLTAWITGRFALQSLTLIAEIPSYQISTGAAYAAVIVFSAVAGSLIAAFAYAQRRTVEPDTLRFPIRYIMPVAAVTAVIIAYGTFRLGIEIMGDVEAGVITVAAAAMAVVALLTGFVAGGITTAVVDTLARPAFMNVQRDELPASTGEMFAEMMRAVGAPLIGLVGAAAFAIGLSQLLVAVEGTGAVVIFSVVAALVLGGATLIALRPWERDGSTE